MLYNPPFADPSTQGPNPPGDPYVNGNPSTGIKGSIPPAASIEYPQREIVNFITDCGIAPTNGDLFQLAKGVQTGRVVYGVDQGPTNAVAIALAPVLLAYTDGMVFKVLIANTNSGPSTFNAGPGPLNIVRRGGTPLGPGDMPGGYITMLHYNALHNNVELYGNTFQAQTLVPIMSANMNLYVNGSTGDDTLYDGTSPTITGSHGPFKTIGKAMATTFTYGPSVYTMTINVAAGTYPEAVTTPNFPGPGTIIKGAGIGSTVVTGAASQHTFQCTGANHLTVRDVTVSANAGGAGPPCCFAATGGGQLSTAGNTASGSASGYIFNAYAGTLTIFSNHTFNGGSQCIQAMSAFFGGFLGLGQNLTFQVGGAGYFYCQEFAVASSDGSMEFPVPGAPTFLNPGYAQGWGGVGCYKFFCDLNGVINTQGQAQSWLPGTVAGLQQRGGWYA